MRNRPAVKILIPYLLGIILADRFDLSMIYLWTLTAVAVLPLLILYKKRYLSASSVLIFLSLLSIGFLRYEVAMIPPNGLHKVLYEQVKVRGTVAKSQKERRGGSSLVVKGKISLISDPSVSALGEVSIRSWDEIFPQKYGDVVEMEGKLSRPRLPRNPGVFDYRKYLIRRGIFATMTVNDPSDVRTIGTGGSAVLRRIKGFRARIEAIIDEIMPSEKSASILKGITLGAREELSDETYQAFLRTGTSHVLAVSGLHIGIIAGWAFFLCNWIRKRVRLKSKTAAYVPIIPLVIVYACMIGFRASVVRASTLVILAIAVTILDRDRDLFNLLAIAALGILIYRPGAIWDAGFRLSFGCVASIAYLMPYWDKWLNKVRSNKWYRRTLYRILQGVAISLSAQIGGVLITAHTFGRVSLAAIPANLAVVPLVGLIIPVGFVSYLAGLIYLPLAVPLAWSNHFFIFILNWIISYFAKFQWAYVPVGGFSFWYIVAFSGIIIFVVNLSFLLKQKRKLLIASVGLVTLFIWTAALSYEGHILKVTYLDVGQGDSMFVEFPNGDNILIDGGPYDSKFDTGERVIYPFLQHKGIGKVDWMVSTHPHNDHAGGLTYTVDNFRVGEVITGSYGLTTATFEELRARLDKKTIKYHDAQPGVIFRDGDIRVEVVSPQTPCESGSESSRMNENSVVLRVAYKGVSFLFTGDIGEKTERLLVDSGRDIKAAVLKVPHQGSKTSSSWQFLRTVQPSVGIIPVGWRNMYHHPSRMILGRYKWLGIETYRTDRQGAITVVTDGRRGWIRTMRQ